MSNFSSQCMVVMLFYYAYDHLDTFKLLFFSERTSFAGMIDEMVEVESTNDYWW